AESSLAPDPSTVQLDEALRERQPETRSLTLFDPGIRLPKLLEYTPEIFGGDTASGVGHGDGHLAVVLRRPHVDGPARRRELHAVREQVEDHLPDAALVARNDVDVGVGGEPDLYTVPRSALTHHRDAALERFLQREGRELELNLPCFDLGEVEHVVD